ncbi:MAG: DUF433 domain-containing protein [Bacteroidales bacterium]|jgi:uncharacterized protein (DUF433 family)|nr:DUF433 domain-containing protein [Bacteroidales bacterium]
MDWREYISTDPKVMYGKPVIKGTRIPVDLILERLSSGETIDQLLEAYPHIDKQAIFACLAYATSSIRNETLDE